MLGTKGTEREGKEGKFLSRWLGSLTRCKGSWGDRSGAGCPLRTEQDWGKRRLSELGPMLSAMGLAGVVFLLSAGAKEVGRYGLKQR